MQCIQKCIIAYINTNFEKIALCESCHEKSKSSASNVENSSSLTTDYQTRPIKAYMQKCQNQVKSWLFRRRTSFNSRSQLFTRFGQYPNVIFAHKTVISAFCFANLLDLPRKLMQPLVKLSTPGHFKLMHLFNHVQLLSQFDRNSNLTWLSFCLNLFPTFFEFTNQKSTLNLREVCLGFKKLIRLV